TATGGVNNLQYLNGATGGVARSLQSKFGDTVNVLDFGADCTGATDSTTAINNALANGGTVYATGGCTFLVNGTVNVPGSATLVGDGKTTFKRGAANTADLISFTGSYGLVRNLVINGNSSATGFANANVEVRLGNTTSENHNTLAQCLVENSAGYGAVINAGVYNSVVDNNFVNVYDQAIAVFAPVNQASNSYIARNLIQSIGWGAILVQSDQGFTVEDNQAIGANIGQPGSRLVVNTSGTSVTWVSGPTFSTVLPGNFLVINGGQEYRVSTVNSSTSITLATSAGTLTSAQASIGSGDLMGFIDTSFGRILNNTVSDSATFGIGLSMGGLSAAANFNDISGNRLLRNGKNAINIANDSGTGTFEGNKVRGNTIIYPGFSGGIGASDQIGIYLQGRIAGTVVDTLIYDNTAISNYGGDGQGTYWLGTDTHFNNGAVLLGKNSSLGFSNQGIFNDVTGITLAAGWGSTASAGSIVSYGDSVQFTVTMGGTGQAVGPQFTINKICDTMVPPSQLLGFTTTASGSNPLAFIWGTQLSTRGSWVGLYNATPTTSGTVTITIKG
ncbi:MAG TPA: glycosyl hydrolase family 28-related protein, partial [Candidatus Saccharimonadales bacterium]|nr:glycosyl hydrolase family 28-related protein [Candidatus Saccharimonadales bacterium]